MINEIHNKSLTLVNCDNLSILPLIKNDYADLIYLDPFFDSNRKHSKVDVKNDEVFSFEDKFKDINSYRKWLHPRLQQCHRILKTSGTLLMHCDDTAQAYIQIELDEIFGRKYRKDTILVKRHVSAPHLAKKKLERNTDFIFRYVKSDNFTWHRPKRFLSEEEIKKNREKLYKNYDSIKMKYYDTQPITRSNNRYNKDEIRIFYDGDGKKIELTTKLGWSWSQKKIDLEWKKDPNIFHFIKKHGNIINVRRKNYEKTIRYLTNFWDHTYVMVPSSSKEDLHFPTQKREGFLEFLINACSNPGDNILDIFAGSGTIFQVAHKLNRKALGIEIDVRSSELIHRRLGEKIAVFHYDKKNGLKKLELNKEKIPTKKVTQNDLIKFMN